MDHKCRLTARDLSDTDDGLGCIDVNHRQFQSGDVAMSRG